MKFQAFDINNPEHKSWVDYVIQPQYTECTRGILALRQDNSIAGAIIMTNWAPNSCQLHIGAETPMVFKHGLHKEAAHYIFNVAHRDIVMGFTPADNEKAIKVNKKLGMRELGRAPNAYKRGVDYVMFYMRRDECTYLENED